MEFSLVKHCNTASGIHRIPMTFQAIFNPGFQSYTVEITTGFPLEYQWNESTFSMGEVVTLEFYWSDVEYDVALAFYELLCLL